MTNHPLTDEICEQLLLQFYRSSPNSYPDLLFRVICKDINTVAMRKAADWQLEQVISYIEASVWFHDPDKCRIAGLREAMRPQEDS